ncbi:hypothetical protein GIB67_017526 [Kingdonia uniflora]|uniref:Mediator of RNA polymerase II transcription subunit 7 n=1 Tax=Kingdonia uniflora TaxID=39325 RepID=A0A7J7M4J9_9MAGN|nr:hypothetical protein GIB67_017526 [Kingdonia uniflora]
MLCVVHSDWNVTLELSCDVSTHTLSNSLLVFSSIALSRHICFPKALVTLAIPSIPFEFLMRTGMLWKIIHIGIVVMIVASASMHGLQVIIIPLIYAMVSAIYTMTCLLQTDDVLPSLEDQGVRQLYPKGPNVDFKKELRSLNRELQLHILELADVLVERPSQYARRVEDISLIFKNLHHLLNSLRPHQARATLIHILEQQIQRRKQAVEDIKRYYSVSFYSYYCIIHYFIH